MSAYCYKHNTQKNQCSQCITDKIDEMIAALQALDAKVNPPKPKPWYHNLKVPLSRLRPFVKLK